MSAEAFFVSTGNLTADGAYGVPLYLRRMPEGHWYVTDAVGGAWCSATTMAAALEGWARDVDALLQIPGSELEEPRLSEAAAYRKALRRPDA